MLYGRPDLLHRLLAVNARAVADYLNAQIEAGAQAVMIFDTWGGTLAEAAYHEFSLAYIKEVVARLTRERDGAPVPSIVFTKGGGLWLEAIAGCGSDAVGIDWTIDIGAARRRVGDRVALQGNLDPIALFAPPMRSAAKQSMCLLPLERAQGTSSIWGTGSPSTRPPTTSGCWSRRCTRRAASCAREVIHAFFGLAALDLCTLPCPAPPDGALRGVPWEQSHKHLFRKAKLVSPKRGRDQKFVVWSQVTASWQRCAQLYPQKLCTTRKLFPIKQFTFASRDLG